MLKRKVIIVALFVIIFILIMFAANLIMKSRLENNINKLFSSSKSLDRVFSYKEIESLPEPVQRYFKYSLPESTAYISSARLKHEGTFRLKPGQKWSSIMGEEYFTAQEIGFVWFGRLPLFSVIDQYIEGKGYLVAKLFSLIKVAEAEGKKIDQGELLRWLGESPWYPTALLPSDKIKWESRDEDSAKIILSNHGQVVEGVFYFNKQGQIIKFTTKRYKEETLENWTGYYRNYKEVKGIQVPHDVEVVWNLESGDFSYARFNITEIEYNKPFKFK